MALFDKRFQYIISSTGLMYFISVFLCSFISVLSFDNNTTPPHEWFVELSSMIGFSLIISVLILSIIIWNYFKDKTLFQKKNIYHYFLFFIIIFISSVTVFPILLIQVNENVFEKKFKIIISSFSFISFFSSLFFLFYFFSKTLESYK